MQRQGETSSYSTQSSAQSQRAQGGGALNVFTDLEREQQLRSGLGNKIEVDQYTTIREKKQVLPTQSTTVHNTFRENELVEKFDLRPSQELRRGFEKNVNTFDNTLATPSAPMRSPPNTPALPLVQTQVTEQFDIKEINAHSSIPTHLTDQSEEITTYVNVVTETPPEITTVHKDIIETTTHVPALPPTETTTTVKKEVVNTNVELPAPPPVFDVVKNVEVLPVQASSVVERINLPQHTVVEREVVETVLEPKAVIPTLE